MQKSTLFRAAMLMAAITWTAAAPAAAGAQEVFGGAYAHGADTLFTLETQEGGVDIAAGVRYGGIAALDFAGSPQPYLIASLNTGGDTSFAGAGLSWLIGKGPVYVRPGIGLVVHDGPQLRVNSVTGYRTDLGSRLLFEPEIGIGYRVGERTGIEASWMHISHGRLLNRDQNPGLDMIGVRVTHRLP